MKEVMKKFIARINQFIYDVVDKKGAYDIDKNIVSCLIICFGIAQAWVQKEYYMLLIGVATLTGNSIMSVKELKTKLKFENENVK
jgi:hypothetical protein